jgi:hypothetical protein
MGPRSALKAAVADPPGEGFCLVNARIPGRRTGLSASPWRHACAAIKGTRIAELTAQPRPGVRAIDVDGASVLPGFIDAHTHLESAAEGFCTVSWAGDRADAAEHLRPAGSWELDPRRELVTS